MGEVKINDDCIGCGCCVVIFPKLFKVKDSKATIKNSSELTEDDIKQIGCPMDALVIT